MRTPHRLLPEMAVLVSPLHTTQVRQLCLVLALVRLQLQDTTATTARRILPDKNSTILCNAGGASSGLAVMDPKKGGKPTPADAVDRVFKAAEAGTGTR